MPVYLKIDGLTGGVTSEKFAGQMSISSFSWGFTIPVNTSGGMGADRQASGKVQAGELHVVKQQDKSTVDLMQKSFGGEPFKNAILTVTRNVKGGEDKLMEYTMDNVILSSFQTAGSDGGDNPTEQLSLHFSKIAIAQFTLDVKSAGQGPARAAYDFETNKKV